jgi:endonuclease/exonuclease/phosphatase (EEP) superfamily protein YafD
MPVFSLELIGSRKNQRTLDAQLLHYVAAKHSVRLDDQNPHFFRFKQANIPGIERSQRFRTQRFSAIFRVSKQRAATRTCLCNSGPTIVVLPSVHNTKCPMQRGVAAGERFSHNSRVR